MKEYIYSNKIIVLIIVLLVMLGLTQGGYIIYLLSEDKVINEPIIAQNIETEIEEEKIFIDIKGEVKKPGVYELSKGSMVIDGINKAGGFKEKAYKNNINLSKKLVDESVIYVYSKTEYKALNKNNIEVCPINNVYIDTCLEKGASNIVNDNSINDNSINNDSVNEEKSALININTASKDELITITGIGASKAEDIILHRETNGLFETIEDITNVSGIGDLTFEKIKSFITV